MNLKPLPLSFIESELAKERVRNYKANAHRILSEALSNSLGETVEDTKSVWYSASQLLEWADEIIRYGGDGIRIYFGQKEELETGKVYDEKLAEPRPGQLCLVIVPTRKGSYDGSHINIVYDEQSDFKRRKEITTLEARDRSFNLGGYCPPLCPLEGEDFFE